MLGCVRNTHFLRDIKCCFYLFDIFPFEILKYPSMADTFYCTQNNANTCFDDQFDCNATNNKVEQCSIFLPHTLLGFALQSEERVRGMVEKEIQHLPSHDYLKRLRSGDLDLKFRREALDWIWKVGLFFFTSLFDSFIRGGVLIFLSVFGFLLPISTVHF